MSTRPGPDSWNDTGLVDEPDEEPVNLVQESEDTEPRDRGEDYQPLTARPDRDGHADEADVADQAVVVPEEDDDEEDL
ncbi:hypothetical protein [Ruania albidiflava]|uniref:hypothetical protein n=1 Tax=Ruania albidiflava TaxID=366586 RepID=UPI0003B53F69|nr:hypothetical protein [Ruania albidiflava]